MTTQRDSVSVPVWQQAVLVFLGGAVGALTRVAITQWFLLVPLAVVNISGAFWLGVLTGLAVPRRLRLLLGTGLLGGFTSYSALVSAMLIVPGQSDWVAGATALASLPLGLLAAWLGVWIAGARPAGSARSDDPAQSEGPARLENSARPGHTAPQEVTE